MILIGLLSLYKLTKKGDLLRLAEKMTEALINRFFDGEKLIPQWITRLTQLNPVRKKEYSNGQLSPEHIIANYQ